MSATMECVGGPLDGDALVFYNTSPDQTVPIYSGTIDPICVSHTKEVQGVYRPDFRHFLAIWWPER